MIAVAESVSRHLNPMSLVATILSTRALSYSISHAAKEVLNDRADGPQSACAPTCLSACVVSHAWSWTLLASVTHGLGQSQELHTKRFQRPAVAAFPSAGSPIMSLTG
jgi:hypothetical protein